MHPKAYQEYEKILSQKYTEGIAVLEIGAIPSDKSLLCMKLFDKASHKIGINLDEPCQYKDFSILKGNANAMTCFTDNQFDIVLCNDVLEHDKFFWKTISEIRRVTKSGGFIVIGVPGYTESPIGRYVRGLIKKIPSLHGVIYRYINFLNSATFTYKIHNHPGDFYRFSYQTFRDVFFEGMADVHIFHIMSPPRIIGYGTKP